MEVCLHPPLPSWHVAKASAERESFSFFHLRTDRYMYYLTTLSVAQTVTGVSYSAVVFGLCGISARMIGASCELEMICEELFMAQSRYTLAFD